MQVLARQETDARNDLLLEEVDKQLERLTAMEANYAFNSEVQKRLDGIDSEPTTLKEALSSPHANEWAHAAREELLSLHANHTWDIVTSTDKRGIGSKWVFKTKVNPDNSIRFKARLVIKGYNQIQGIDFQETYAPVSRLASLRVLLAFASEHQWKCDHMDVVTAFLHPEIDQKDVLMELPDLSGLGDLSEFGLMQSTLSVVRLRKALYGLKQAPRLWFQEIDNFLRSLGFLPSSVEPNLYLMTSVMILLYVDDLSIFYKSLSEVTSIKRSLETRYNMKDLGPIKRFLGIDIESTENGFALHQTSYISSLLRRFRMEDAYEIATPIDTKVSLEGNSDNDDPSLDESVDQKQYLAIVGSLMYAALGGRPDISYAVSLLSRFNVDPRTRHLTAAKRVLRYLKRTKNLKLAYKSTGKELYGFVDSDWGNSKGRKPVGGYTFTLGGAAISWCSKKQSLVALSTEEAEYTAFTEGSREVLWLRQLLSDINNRGEMPVPIMMEGSGGSGCDMADERSGKPTTIFADNQAAIGHVTSAIETSARSKHFDIRLQHSRDHQRKGTINFTYIKSSENTADILTKGLPIEAHQRHVKGLGLV
jgi:plasmid maintenance system killer protein